MNTGFTAKHLVRNQIPRHIRDNNPLFISFLDYYYEFQEETAIQKCIQDVLAFADSDSSALDFIESFFEELKGIPKNIAVDRRLVAKHVYDLYKSKGSENSIKLLFRIVYGEEISIEHPKENILKASDGRWVQDTIVTVQVQDGVILDSSNYIQFDGSPRKFKINKVEKNLTLNRIFFTSYIDLSVTQNQLVKVYTDDHLDFFGPLFSTFPSSISVIDGGKYWQVGQCFTIDTNQKKTICQVARVGDQGTLEKVNIIDYGFTTNNQSLPFNITFGNNNVIFLGNNAIYDSNNTFAISPFSGEADANSPEQWFDSQTIIKLDTSLISKTFGKLISDKGTISSPNIRLHDGLYYQLFSYVIHTQNQVADYQNVHKIVHPAGVKYFSFLDKIAVIDINNEIELIHTCNTINVNLFDSIVVTDSIGKTIDKNLQSVLNQNNLYVTPYKQTFEFDVGFGNDSVVFDGNIVQNIAQLTDAYFAEDYAFDPGIIDEMHVADGTPTMNGDSLVFGSDTVVVPII